MGTNLANFSQEKLPRYIPLTDILTDLLERNLNIKDINVRGRFERRFDETILLSSFCQR